jgi:outer membrane immunogenic protein
MTRMRPSLGLTALGALALAAMIGPAGAADLPPLAPKAPVMAPVPSWYGFFIGIQGGYGRGSDSVEFTDATGIYAADLGVTIPFTIAGDPSGAVVGARWGTNWQSGNLVYGFLSDFSWTDVRSSETLILTSPVLGTRINSAEQHLEWFGTTRVRAGYLATPNLLLYGSGGFASGRMEVSVANTVPGVPCAIGGACPAGRDDTYRFGWAAGVGAEYQWGNWSLSLDYIHYDLGRFNFAYSDGVSPDFIVASTQFSGDMIRGAINYRFDWTPLDLVLGRRP